MENTRLLQNLAPRIHSKAVQERASQFIRGNAINNNTITLMSSTL